MRRPSVAPSPFWSMGCEATSPHVGQVNCTVVVAISSSKVRSPKNEAGFLMEIRRSKNAGRQP
ncbi:hypothetical protein ACFXGT_35285 [Streptomyces sp. NPDC059352]|uniref:hypothetical protein n=1 Tax=Streptomyces sp. NPDC059352 TaxID=3346810 RepID=UPI0036B3F707